MGSAYRAKFGAVSLVLEVSYLLLEQQEYFTNGKQLTYRLAYQVGVDLVVNESSVATLSVST